MVWLKTCAVKVAEGDEMSDRKTWIKGKMHFPDDIDPADIDWIVPVKAYQQQTTETESERREENEIHSRS